MPDAIRSAFPQLCAILADCDLDSDIENALTFTDEGPESLRDALEGRVFRRHELMFLLAAPLHSDLARGEAEHLERCLRVVVDTVGLPVARQAFRDQLGVNDRSKLEDVAYEIAVAAKACEVFDRGSLNLKKQLADASKPRNEWKKPDIYGTYKGQPVRIEVTVRHPALPPSVHLEHVDYVKDAAIGSGFRLTLRTAMETKADADQVRALVELLYESHEKTGGGDVEIGEVQFKWDKSVYRCPQAFSPIDTIFFETEVTRGAACDFTPNAREIIHRCQVQNTIPEHMRDQFRQQPGVTTFMDVRDAPTEVPESTEIRQKVARKLLQCEDGIFNIVAIGVPPFDDRFLEDAVLGVSYAGVALQFAVKGERTLGRFG